MSRPLLILLILVVLVMGILFGLASLDREVPVSHVEQPVTNVATH
ncbi:hypothetical protein [Sphingomonas nostoxanthinifaciens]|nr:hypothetical protein [Sphingomonas nostoxanthinifaciens]